MSELPLTDEQQQLRDRVSSLLSAATQRKEKNERKIQTLFDELASTAHALHASLKASGHEPRHHRYMLENRSVPPTDPMFYRHVHPVQDLLNFIVNPHANDDPEDRTIDEDFEFKVFSHRWGHPDTYRIRRTHSGWDVSHISIGGPCDKAGRPFLFENLRHDSIEYPTGLGNRFEWLWFEAQKRGLTKEELQAALNQLAEWVARTERESPNGEVWQGYK